MAGIAIQRKQSVAGHWLDGIMGQSVQRRGRDKRDAFLTETKLGLPAGEAMKEA